MNRTCLARTAFMAAVFFACAFGVRAEITTGELSDLIRRNKLGLTKQEAERAMLQLNAKRVDGDLNKSLTARLAASRQFQSPTSRAQESSVNPWDGSERADLGHFDPLKGQLEGRIIDERTGKPLDLPKEVLEAAEDGQQVHIQVSGSCPAAATRAIRDLQDFVRVKVESGQARGAEGDFFLFLYSLFFIPRRYAANIPAVTSGRTVTPTAIATFHRGSPGLMTFDCEKFDGLGESLQRKIACHEFYHKYNFEGGEPPAYAIMPRC